MGSVFNRGTRAKPNWYVKYRDRDGRWKMVPSNQPTNDQAKQFLAQIEANVANGRVGIQRQTVARLCNELMDEWVKGLDNRNAKDDANRLNKHLKPRFGKVPLTDVTSAVILGWL